MHPGGLLLEYITMHGHLNVKLGDRCVCVLTVTCPLLGNNHIMLEIMSSKNKCLVHDERTT